MQSFLQNMEFEKISENKKRIIDYIMKNLSRIPYLAITEIARESGTSTSSLSRVWKDMGFSSFKEFKDYLKNDMKITPATKVLNTLNKVETEDLISELINQQISFLQDTLEHLSRNDFENAVEAMVTASRIYLFAPGPSEGLAYLLMYRLRRFGLNLIKMEKSGADIYESLVHISSNDIVIIFGLSKKLVETHIVLDYAKRKGYKTILITDLLVSDMVTSADIVLYCCRGKVNEFHSMVSTTALLDCLAVGIASKTSRQSLDCMEKLTEIRKMYSSLIPR